MFCSPACYIQSSDNKEGTWLLESAAPTLEKQQRRYFPHRAIETEDRQMVLLSC